MSESSAVSWTVACQTPLSMGFPRQEYWSGFPFPSPGDPPDPGNKPASPALQADSLPLSNQGSPPMHIRDDQILGAGYCPGPGNPPIFKTYNKNPVANLNLFHQGLP